MEHRAWRFVALIVVVIVCRGEGVARGEEGEKGRATIRLEVDATDLPRNLLRSTMWIEATPGPMDLRFVKWTPGNHAPSGPIQNVVDLEVRDCRGERLAWDRDAQEPTRITVAVPEGCEEIRVEMRYIAGQPGTTSRSTDTYGLPDYGVLNWNTALFYPAGASLQEITVVASLGVPSAWKYATSLRTREDEADGGRFGTLSSLQTTKPVTWVDFQSVPLGELIDSPVIMGRWLTVREMETGGVPGVERVAPHYFCVVGPDEKSVVVPEWLARRIDATTREAIAMMAPMGFPRARYMFLVALGENLRFGVEHGQSTLIGAPARVFRDATRNENTGGGGVIGVVPHEYFHAWCGKLVAPEGVVRRDYHTPISTELLWVYEGLTTYYTSILSARGGMTNQGEFLEGWTESAVAYERRAGRLWRSVEDTARAAANLRERSTFWGELRQGQEYYGQGALFWLEADALIRRGTEGKRSLDDFCRALFASAAVNATGSQATYAREDIVGTLASVYEGADWNGLIRDRIERPRETLDLAPLLALAGYRLIYAEEPTPLQKKKPMGSDLRTSLGMRVDKAGEVTDLTPGGPADETGLAFGMKILAVNGWVFTPERLAEAVKDSPRGKRIELTLSFGDRIETRTIAYEGGPRWPRLARIEEEMDILGAIATPLLKREEAAPGGDGEKP